MKRILLIGGGSGGHVFPLFAVAGAMRSIDPSVELIAVGDGPFMPTVARLANIPFVSLLGGKVRRYASLLNVIDILKFPFTLIQSLWILLRYMPDAIFCKGTLSSVAPCLVAKLYFIPIFTHESDSVPGRANKFIGKLATKVFTSFENASKYFEADKVILTGNPIRPELLNGNRDTALASFNFRSDKKIIFVYSGSQGSRTINDTILASLAQLVQNYQIIHQCGESQFESVTKEVERLEKEGANSFGSMIHSGYRLLAFLSAEQVALAYACADVVISRGGASNLCEIASVGKPGIIIPISDSNGNHQVLNAIEFQKFGGVMIEEQNLTPHILMNQIEGVTQPAKSASISQQIKGFARPDSAMQIASLLLS